MNKIAATNVILAALLFGCAKQTPVPPVKPDAPQPQASVVDGSVTERTVEPGVEEPAKTDDVVSVPQAPATEVTTPEVVVEPAPVVTTPATPLPKIPDRAVALMPDVIQAIDDIWPDMPMRSYFPAQIEQESCISLTHSKCWNPRAELKTAREYGFGLGQITIAYKADGTERFNVFEEVKLQHPDLRNWAWEDRYNPLLQIKAIVVKNRVNWGAIKWETADLDNKMAFLATFYNGGNPSRDRQLCVNTPGCDPSKWWGNVEKYSIKFKTKLKEYGNRSLFEISREYPVNVLRVRRPKYVPYTGT